MIFRSAIKGAAGMVALLGVYFGMVSLISGWDFAASQFSQFWYFIVSLAVGFGIQIGLYSYLKRAILRKVPEQLHQSGAGVVAVSGTTSIIAMISCCAHYLANILPIIGITGIIAFIGQYQVELFWFSLILNIAGISYITSRIVRFLKV